MGVLFLYFADGVRNWNINCHNLGEKADGNFTQVDVLAFSPTVMCVDYFSLVHKSQEVQCDSPTLQNVLIVPGALCNVVIAFIFMTVLLLTFMHVSVGAN